MNIFNRFIVFVCGIVIWSFAFVGSAMIAAKGAGFTGFIVAALISYICGTIAAYFITQTGARMIAALTVWVNIVVSVTMLGLSCILLVSALVALPPAVPNYFAFSAAVDWYIALATSLPMMMVYGLIAAASLVTVMLLVIMLKGRNAPVAQ